MSDNTGGIVKQIAVGTAGHTVHLELICLDAYGAQVIADDIRSRLQTDRVFSLICKVGSEVPERAT